MRNADRQDLAPGAEARLPPQNSYFPTCHLTSAGKSASEADGFGGSDDGTGEGDGGGAAGGVGRGFMVSLTVLNLAITNTRFWP